MSDFDDFLTDLDETVAEDVDWGDDDDDDEDGGNGGGGCEAVTASKRAVEELFAAVSAVNGKDSDDSDGRGDELDFNTVNAVAKAEVSEAVARSFLITPDTAGGAVPSLADVGLPADLDAFVIDDLLSAKECQDLIDAAERAKMTFWDQSRENPRADYRNADTVEVQQPVSAAEMWDRIMTVLPTTAQSISVEEGSARHQPDLEGTWEGVGTNNKLLLARYRHGGHFSPHTDGYSIVNFNHRSMYTMLVYLNRCEGGGGTRFYHDDQVGNLVKDADGRYTGQDEHILATVETKIGRALCFFHNILHEGCAVEPGSEKYIIRSDLMYDRTPPICNAPKDLKAFELYQEADELAAQGKVDASMKLYRQCVKMSPALAKVYGL